MMKSGKTFLQKSLLMMLAFVLSFSYAPAQTDAAQKAKLNKSSVVLYTGHTTQLRVKNNQKKVRWCSSKSSVATVNKNGRVTAKKKGSAKITAKVGKKSYVCQITVKRKASSNSNRKGTYVYVTDTGSKYHRAGCRYLRKSSRKIKKSSAKAQGYTACSVCW